MKFNWGKETAPQDERGAGVVAQCIKSLPDRLEVLTSNPRTQGKPDAAVLIWNHRTAREMGEGETDGCPGVPGPASLALATLRTWTKRVSRHKQWGANGKSERNQALICAPRSTDGQNMLEEGQAYDSISVKYYSKPGAKEKLIVARGGGWAREVREEKKGQS